ncbi:MAG TPA: hypothetical protein VIS06_12595 [Mycobacteriales bacterium]
MSVDTANLTQGPATVYIGDFGATEPADSDVATAPAASAWTDIGGTLGGTTITVARQYAVLNVDQVVDEAERRLTGRTVTVATQMAEPTLDNLKNALNGGVSASGTGFKSYEPSDDTSSTQPTYKALIIDGFGPSGKRRRVIVRKVLSVGDVSAVDSKTDQKVFAVSFAGHYVSSTIKPFKKVDAT